jgi:predicted CopG family antitoxin
MTSHKQRHTITINHDAFVKLRSNGVFGESYSDLICRLADSEVMIKDDGNKEDG